MGPVGRSWTLLAVLGAVALGRSVAGCLPPDDPGDEGTDIELKVLGHVGPGVVLPALVDFRGRAASIAEAVRAWGDAVAGDGDAETAREAVQAAWRDAMASWQVLEVMQVGPAGSSLTTVGGE